MKLKQILAGVLTGIMVVASVPVSGLDAAIAWADTVNADAPGNDTADVQSPQGLGFYNYRSILDGLSASSDGAFKIGAGADQLTDSSTYYALSRFNTGNMPVSNELSDNNNLYFSLDSAANLSKLTWWTTNRADMDYNNGINVREGTLLRCRLYLSEKAAASNTAAAMESLTWGEGVVAEFDPNQDDHEENEFNRVGYDIDLKKLFGDKADNARAIRMEVLNTAGRYTVSSGTAIDQSNAVLVGNAVEIYSQDGKLSSGINVCADFSAGAGNPLSNLLESMDEKNIDPADPSGDKRMQSAAAGSAGALVNGTSDKLVDNNNLYFTLMNDDLDVIEPKTIGRLTYMAGMNYGSISELRIYTSNDEKIQYEDDKTLEQIEDWNLVYSNVKEDTKVGKTETLDDDGNRIYLEGDDIVPWPAYRSAPLGWENAHVAVFKEPVEARYVRLEVVRTANTDGSQLAALNNKWISGRRVFIYEAEEVMSYGDVSEIVLQAEEPMLNTTLGRVNVINQTSAYLDGNSWEWTDENGNTVTGEAGAKASLQLYTLKVTLNVKKPDRIRDNLTVKLQIPNYSPEDEDDTRVEEVTIPASNIVIQEGKGDNDDKVVVTYRMQRPKDTREAWQALKDYVAQIKPVYDQGNKYAENEQGKPEGIGLNDHKYTERAWKDFADLYAAASTWTQGQKIPSAGAQGPTESEGEEEPEPSGRRTLGQYVSALTNLKELYANLEKSLIHGRRDFPASENIELTVAPPVTGESPRNARLKYDGSMNLNSDINLQYREGNVIKDGFIYGKSGDDKEPGSASLGVAIAPSSDEKNAILDFQGTAQFMVHFKIKVKDVPTAKQSIVGNFNDGYGMHLLEKGNNLNPYKTENAALIGYARFENNSAGAEQWAQVQAALPDDWFGDKEHDIVFIYNGNRLLMYVDGEPGEDTRNCAGALNPHDQRYEFAIGYNPRVGSVQNNPGEYFKGGFKDFKLYGTASAADGTVYEVPDYAQLENLAKPVENNESWTADKFMTKLEEILDEKDALVTLSTEEASYSVHSTKWVGIRDEGMSEILTSKSVFNDYMGYRVEVVVDAKHPFQFKNIMQGSNALQNEEGTAYDASVELIDHETAMTLVYTFAPKAEHPRDTLQKYIDEDVTAKVITADHARALDRNETAEYIRIYTNDTWSPYLRALETAAALTGTYKKYDEYIAQYANAQAALMAALGNLTLAADTCECIIGEITGFEGEILDMKDQTSYTKDLGDLEVYITGSKLGGDAEPDYTMSGRACLKHKDTSDEDMTRAEYALDDAANANTAGAVLENGILTVTKSGHADVVLTAFYGDKTLSKTVRYEVTGTVADTAQRSLLKTLITNAKNKYPGNDGTYTDESWMKYTNALNAAILLVGDPADPKDFGNEEATVGDVNAAAAALQSAMDVLASEKSKSEGAAALTQAISSAAAYLKQESQYTPESWKAFIDAYTAATASDRDENKLKDLAAALTQAIAGLKKKENTASEGDKFKDNYTETVNGAAYQVTNAAALEVIYVKGKNKRKVTIPAMVTVGSKKCRVVGVAGGAFKKCGRLQEVVIGANVRTISRNAFTNCRKLKKITFKSKKLPAMKKAFKGTKKNPTVKVAKALRKTKKAKNQTLRKLKKAGLKLAAKNIK